MRGKSSLLYGAGGAQRCDVLIWSQSSCRLQIEGGRHPTVEQSCEESGQNFEPNSLELPEQSPFAVITGPNM